jgi:hypothetical protein
MTSDGEQDGRWPPGSFVGRERERAELRAALEETSARRLLFLLSGEPMDGWHYQLESRSKLASRFRSLVLSLAAVIAISASNVLGVMRAYADDGSLIAMGGKRFQNLSVAERRLLEYADVSNQHRGEFSAGGTSAEPKDPSNDPAQSVSWPVQRNIRPELIRWLLVDRDTIARVDPKGIRVLGARIVGKLDLSHVHTERTIALVRCKLDEVNLDLAEIQSLDLSGSYATSVHADHVVAHSSMFLGWDGTDRGGDFHCSGKVYLPSARVDGDLSFGGGRFQHPSADPEYWEGSKKDAIDAAGSEVRGDLIVCCDFEAHGAVDLINVTIGKTLMGQGGRFINPDNVAISALGLTAANVWLSPGPDYPSQDAQVDGFLDFTTAQVQNNFALNRAKFNGKPAERHGFQGTGLVVHGGFVWTEVTLQPGAFLDLRGAQLGGLLDDARSWPSPGKLLIDGLSYKGFGSDSPRDVASRLRWLRLQPGFFPQPYRQLANWMRENGDDASAAKVIAAKAEDESGSSRRGTKPVLTRVLLGTAIFALLSLALTATLLWMAYFSRLKRKVVGEASQTSPLPRAFEIYQLHGPDPRGTKSIENEKPPERGSSIEAEHSVGAAGNGTEGRAIFRREGDFWTLAYRGTTFRLKDVKGLAYIAFLLAHPGERFHVRELIARVEGVAAAGSAVVAEVSPEVSTTHDLGDAGDALDQHAQADYRHRLRELAEELAEAERLNDIGRAESIRSEQDFLSAELLAATGIGGRDRKAVAHAERARSMVRKNIRAGLEKIRNEDAVLGRYFAASIKTGYYCAYLPDPERKIPWQL